MQGMGSYVLQLCAGAVLVSVVTSLTGGNGQVKWICGLFLTFLVISPVRKMDVDWIWEQIDEIDMEAQRITTQAQEDTLHSIRDGIIQRTRAYILDEAEALGAEVCVVALALDEEKLIPVRVELQGNISPYHRRLLSDFLEEDLGIRKEEQIWKD